jgi:hypothetical protein
MILCSLVVLLVGLPAAQAKEDKTVELLSDSFGMVVGQKVRISVTLHRLANPSFSRDPVNVLIQLLDDDGDVIAQSAELRVMPGETRFWDQLRAPLPATTEIGGRIQLRARILVPTRSGQLNRTPLTPTIEVIDTLTGGTIFHMGKTFLIFASGPSRSDDDDDDLK